MEEMNEKQAKEVLRNLGYFVGNLWHVEDVKNNYKNVDGSDVDDETAQDILSSALQNECTMEQIWFAIRNHAEESDLVKIED